MASVSPSSRGFTLITVPSKMKGQIAKKAKLTEIKRNQDILVGSRRGNLKKPLITCKDNKLNFYYGQSYGKFQPVRLASQSWCSRKTRGDFFEFHKYNEHPGLLNDFEDDITFTNLELDNKIVDQLSKHGFHTPTNIQRLAIPHIIRGSNTVVSAETGNGKTYAFLLPIIHQILQAKDTHRTVELNSPRALLIVPGRELAFQIRDMARLIGSDLGLNVNSIIGGRMKRAVLNPRLGKPDILVASLGALSKAFTSRLYKRDLVRHIVLDEVDTLLDDSFNEQTKHFLSSFPIKGVAESGEVDHCSGIQLSLVGATFPKRIRTILDRIVDVDSLVEVKTPFLHRIPPHISQTFIRVGFNDKAERLVKLTKRLHRERTPTVIFSNTSKCALWVSKFLNDNDIPCSFVHGNVSARDRMSQFRAFVNEDVDIISCTDLVSRGLDTIRAKHVINFEFPKFMSDFLHRCGRVGRVGSTGFGHVTSFVYYKSEVNLVQKIEYAARKTEVLPRVNANIKRILNLSKEKRELAAQQDSME